MSRLLHPFLLVLGLASTAAAGVDQQQPFVDLSGADAAIGGATIEQVLAQVVVAGRDGFLAEIRIPLYQVHSPRDELYLYVTEARGGVPSGRVLGQARLPAWRFPSSATDVFTPMPLERPVWMRAGTPYAIVLKCMGEMGCALSPVGNFYRTGDGLYQNSTSAPGWHAIGPREDLPFQSILGVRDQCSKVDRSAAPLTIGGSSDQKLAQVVRAGQDGDLCAIELPLGIGTGELVLEIHKVVGGVPVGPISLDVFPADELVPSSDGLVVLTLNRPLPMPAGTEFAFVLSSTGFFSTLPGPAGNPYRSGGAFFDARPNPPGWVPFGAERDLAFCTRVDLR